MMETLFSLVKIVLKLVICKQQKEIGLGLKSISQVMLGGLFVRRGRLRYRFTPFHRP